MPVSYNPFLPWNRPVSTPGGTLATPAAPPTATYNYSRFNPAPQSGSGAFGAVPGPLSLPNPAGDVGAQLPGLGGLNRTLSSDLQAKLGGQISPGTQSMLQDLGAAWGVGSGMPGSGLSRNRTLRDLGLLSENQVEQGIHDYSTVLPTVAGTQTVSPALQTEIGLQNAINAAAPDPTQAASYARQLFEEYLNRMRSPAGGSGAFSIVGGGGPAFGPQPSPVWAGDRPNPPALFGPGGGPGTNYGTVPNSAPGGGNFPTAGTGTTGGENPEDLAWYFSGGSMPGTYDWSNLANYGPDQTAAATEP